MTEEGRREGALAGKRIVITRQRSQAEGMASALRQQGATPILFPTIEVVPMPDMQHVDRAIDELNQFAWIVFTSVNGVSVFTERIEQRTGQPAQFGSARIAAVGTATAAELERRGVTPAFVPSEFLADRIPDGLGEVKGRRVLLPLAASARKDLASELANRGAFVADIALYDTVAPAVDADALAEIERGVDAVTFTSSSSVRHFVDMTVERTSQLLERAIVVCIGPITERTAEQSGLRVDLVAEPHTTDGIIAALVTHFSDPQPSIADLAT
ncbi:MAG: uroporphyrinogen-III synthase [Gemmatimonadetes bacterium]|nr:uroporphyrinogen-III synthase [Gemmatimonadota bacterium]